MEALAFDFNPETYTISGNLEKYLEFCDIYRDKSYVDVLYDDGVIFVNQAAPSRRHNAISASITGILLDVIKDRSSCQVLSSDEEYVLVDKSRAKPDVSVACEDYKYGDIPILAVEILSASNGRKAPEPYEYHFGRKIDKMLLSGCRAVLCVRQDVREAYLHTANCFEYDTFKAGDSIPLDFLNAEVKVSDFYMQVA